MNFYYIISRVYFNIRINDFEIILIYIYYMKNLVEIGFREEVEMFKSFWFTNSDVGDLKMVISLKKFFIFFIYV